MFDTWLIRAGDSCPQEIYHVHSCGTLMTHVEADVVASCTSPQMLPPQGAPGRACSGALMSMHTTLQVCFLLLLIMQV